MTDELERPAWPYTLGTIGGAVFALGALLVLLLLAKGGTVSEGMAMATFVILAAGGALLGIGWAGMFKYGQGGFGTVAGSFVVAAVIVWLLGNRHDSDVLFFGRLFVGSLALFALGHVFVKNTAVRITSSIALLALAIEFAAENRHWHLSLDTHKLLAYTALLFLALTGVVVAITMPALRRQDLSQPTL
jgi:hypothetical protein